MKHSPLATSHVAAGARIAPGASHEALLTFGDVPGEYRAATEACALFDETERGLVLVRGADAASFLHRLLANEVRALAPGEGNRNLLLSPKGKVRFDFDLQRVGDLYALSTAPGAGASLAEALETFHFSEAVEIADASESHAPLALVGPATDAVARQVLGAALPDADRRTLEIEQGGGHALVTRLSILGSPALRIDAGPQGVERLWREFRAAGARPAGRVVADILRVEAGAARAQEDVDDTIYPQEARLESAFSLSKGCYVGQEVVAKIDTYGGLNKRLVALAVSHDEPVARGTRLFQLDAERAEWRDLGVVTSWAYSFARDTGVVLAYVKRKHQAPGTSFRVGDGPATATIVPLPLRAGAVAITGDFE